MPDKKLPADLLSRDYPAAESIKALEAEVQSYKIAVDALSAAYKEVCAENRKNLARAEEACQRLAWIREDLNRPVPE